MTILKIPLLIFLAALPASVQPHGGTIRGRAIDVDSKTPIYGAIIVVRTGEGKRTSWLEIADSNGCFEISDVEPGRYILDPYYPGFVGGAVGPFTVTADTVFQCTIEYAAGELNAEVSAEEARRDLDSGKVQIYLVSWPLLEEEEIELAEDYGFEIGYTGCTLRRTDRYNAVVINYLKTRNGPDWYREFMREWCRFQDGWFEEGWNWARKSLSGKIPPK